MDVNKTLRRRGTGNPKKPKITFVLTDEGLNPGIPPLGREIRAVIRKEELRRLRAPVGIRKNVNLDSFV
jgi:hypothetical protein